MVTRVSVVASSLLYATAPCIRQWTLGTYPSPIPEAASAIALLRQYAPLMPSVSLWNLTTIGAAMMSFLTSTAAAEESFPHIFAVSPSTSAIPVPAGERPSLLMDEFATASFIDASAPASSGSAAFIAPSPGENSASSPTLITKPDFNGAVDVRPAVMETTKYSSVPGSA